MKVPKSPRAAVPARRSPHQAALAAAVLVATAAGLSAQSPPRFEGLPRLGLPATSERPVCSATGDVDGDGHLDIVVGNVAGSGWTRGQQDRLFLGDGRGNFEDVTATRMPAANTLTADVVLGDVDGDGDLDAVFGHEGARNSLYLNDGSGVFTDATAGRMPGGNPSGRSLALADVDGDGDLDLLFATWQRYVTVTRLYLNDGAGVFTDGSATRLPPDQDFTVGIEVGDLDGDGDLDFACGKVAAFGFDSLPAQDRVYLNDGSGTFADVTATAMPGGLGMEATSSVALGDVDGDGDLDWTFTEYFYSYPGGFPQGSGFIGLYLNDGSGVFADATAANIPVNTNGRPAGGLLATDVDGDGDLDAVIRDGGWTLFTNDGSGALVREASFALPSGVWVMEAADVDKDSDPDLVVNLQGQAAVTFNMRRHLHAPSAPRIGQAYTLDASLRYGPVGTTDVAAVFVSLAPASIPLPSLGVLGIDPGSAVPFPLLAIPQATGVGSVGLTVPSDPGLVGLPVYSQALIASYPSDLRLSNVVRDVIGR